MLITKLYGAITIIINKILPRKIPLLYIFYVYGNYHLDFNDSKQFIFGENLIYISFHRKLNEICLILPQYEVNAGILNLSAGFKCGRMR